MALALAGASSSCGREPAEPTGPTGPTIVRLDLRGQFSCATLSDGSIQCWGRGGALGYGEVEDLGDDESVNAWGAIPAGGPVSSAMTGPGASCLGYTDGTVRCWGSAATGTLGSGSTVDQWVLPKDRPPVSLDGLAVEIAGYTGRVCALLEQGALQCWGWNENGELGYGTTENVGDDELPTDMGLVQVGAPVTQVSVGAHHTCALLEGGAVKCWGRSPFGQLGRGNTETIGDDETPDSIGPIALGPSPVVQIAAGVFHTCARHQDGNVTCWGSGDHARLGYPNRIGMHVGDNEAPADVGYVSIGGAAIDIAAGQTHTCVLLEGGAVRCWGDSSRGQLGLASTERIGDDEHPSDVPTVRLSRPAVDIAAGSEHNCALLDDGSLQCWGFNQFGQLGYGHTNNIGTDEHPDAAGVIRIGAGD